MPTLRRHETSDSVQVRAATDVFDRVVRSVGDPSIAGRDEAEPLHDLDAQARRFVLVVRLAASDET